MRSRPARLHGRCRPVVLGGLFAALVSHAAVGAAGESRAPAPRRGSREEARIELGRRLFFDPRVSRAGMRSCADCHDPEHGFSDRERTSADDRGPTRRHSQTLIDAADAPSAHWDGAFRRIEDLVTARVTLSQRGLVSSGHEFLGGAARGGLAGDPRGLDRAAGGALASRESGRLGEDGAPDPLSDRGVAPGHDPLPHVDPPTRPKEDPSYGPPEAKPKEPADAPTTPSGRGARAPASSGERGGGADAPAPPATAPVTTPSTPPGASPSTPPAAPAPTAPSNGPSADPVAGAGGGDAKGNPQGAPGAAPAGRDPAPGAGSRPAPPPPDEDPFAPVVAPPGEAGLAFLAPELDTASLPLADQALASAGRYREGFAAAFGSEDVTIARIAEAIADYCRSLSSGPSAYDRHVAGDAAALSESARRGLDLFRGRAGCAQCHVMTGERAAFTDHQFHDTGVTWNGIRAASDAERLEIADRQADLGAEGVTGKPRERRAFKTPTLRDVARRGPYMHDGSARSLEAAVRRYARGTTDPMADARMPHVSLDDREVAALVDFLRALSSDERPGLASTAWAQRAGETRLRFVDLDGAPLAGMKLKLAAAGDRLPGFDRNDLEGWLARTDEAGWIAYAPPLSTHVRIVLPDGLRADGGPLVPDTCRQAEIRVPVRGRVQVLMTMPVGVAAPGAIVGEHVEAQVFPDRRFPRTVLRREASVRVGGRTVALFGAMCRADVPARVLLRLPVPAWGLDRLHLTFDPGSLARIDLSK